MVSGLTICSLFLQLALKLLILQQAIIQTLWGSCIIYVYWWNPHKAMTCHWQDICQKPFCKNNERAVGLWVIMCWHIVACQATLVAWLVVSMSRNTTKCTLLVVVHSLAMVEVDSWGPCLLCTRQYLCKRWTDVKISPINFHGSVPVCKGEVVVQLPKAIGNVSRELVHFWFSSYLVWMYFGYNAERYFENGIFPPLRICSRLFYILDTTEYWLLILYNFRYKLQLCVCVLA